MSSKAKYRLTIDLNALNHLGINLYSNLPAVLSEAVANAWDADAQRVTITFDAKTRTITIEDNGCGMNLEDINKKFLTVGYQRREVEGPTTPEGRHVMGRKGIGKLSLFSIADLVEVHSVKLDKAGKKILEKNAFELDARVIKKLIDEGKGHANYDPPALSLGRVQIRKGTRITLRDVKTKAAFRSGFLRRRLARRFGVIDPAHQFEVVVDGEPITIADRDYLKAIEYIWYFGDDGARYADDAENAKKKTAVDGTIDVDKGYQISGWIGTFDERKSIEEGNNTIVVLAWGKLVQEDLLKDLTEAGVFTKYLIGEVHADFVDADDEDEITTSDRQRLREDDPRYQALKKFVNRVVTDIKLKWTGWRKEDAAERALENPIVKKWFESLGPDNQKHAKRLFGNIESLPVADSQVRIELYKQSIVAFQTLAVKNNLDALSGIETPEGFKGFVSVFKSIDELEAAHFHSIAKGRLGVLSKFQDIAPDVKEKIIQQHIFDHLWLLDPSWERPTTDEKMEEVIAKELKKVDKSLAPEERRARLDIRYRTAAGKNIVIELKKYTRAVNIHALVKQVSKYYRVVNKVLKRYPAESRLLEIICVLGSPPTPVDEAETNEGLLAQYGARYITYDQLIKQARDRYRDYLEAQKEISQIQELIDSLSVESAPAIPRVSVRRKRPRATKTKRSKRTSKKTGRRT